MNTFLLYSGAVAWGVYLGGVWVLSGLVAVRLFEAKRPRLTGLRPWHLARAVLIVVGWPCVMVAFAKDEL